MIIISVPDNEVNESKVPSDIIEYNIIDNLNAQLSFVKFSTKVTLNIQSGLTDLYDKIIKTYKLLEGDLYDKTQQDFEFKTQYDMLSEYEKGSSNTPTSIAINLNSILECMGKDIYVILPNQYDLSKLEKI